MGIESLLLRLLVVLGLVLTNAFFVAAEFALVSVRRSRIQELIGEGSAAARVVQDAIEHINRFIAATQLGITIASLVLGWVGAQTLALLFEPVLKVVPLPWAPFAVKSIAVALAFIVITFLHVLLGELVPKSLALQITERTALFVARPLTLLVTVMSPAIWLLNWFGSIILRALHLSPVGQHPSVHSVEELKILVAHSHEAGVLDDMERELVHRVFRFSDLSVKDVMVHRSQMIALDIAEPVELLLDQAAQTIHTRLPVYEGDEDNIIGVLHLPDLFKQCRRKGTAVAIRELLRKPLVIPETIHLDHLLDTFRAHHSQMAIVVDEFGSTAGLVTLEDVAEEIVGEVQDSLDMEEPSIQIVENQILIRGDTRLEELLERFEWTLEDTEGDTIAGFLVYRLGRLAQVGDTVTTPQGVFRVERMIRRRIAQVSLQPTCETRQTEGSLNAMSGLPT